MTNGRGSRRTGQFRKLFKALPADIQKIANNVFVAFERNPDDPSLDTKALHDTKRGRHRSGSRSVRITLRYRAIYVVDRGPRGDEDPQYCWYWVGSREDYANFVDAR